MLFLFSFASLPAKNTPESIESALMCLFSNDFGYTVVGVKPVSVEQCLNDELAENTFRRELVFSFLQKTFSKSKNFIFRTINRYGYIELINKKALFLQIKKSTLLSTFIKAKYESVDNFFKALHEPSSNIFDAVDKDPVLIASVLGYGEENGRYFIRRLELGTYLQKYPLVTFFPFDQKPGPWHAFPHNFFQEQDLYATPKPENVSNSGMQKNAHISTFGTLDTNFISFDQEWKEIVASEQIWETDPVPPYYISLPVCVAKKGPESDQIVNRFSKAREKIANLFYKKKFSTAIAEIALSN